MPTRLTSMVPHLSRSHAQGVVTACVLAASIFAQASESATRFPQRGWKAIKLKQKEQQRLNWSITRELTPKNVYKLRIERPEGYTETVVTDLEGVVLGRNTGETFELPNRQIGDRYVIYFCKTKARRALRFTEEFVEYPNTEFPTKGWQTCKDSTLTIKKPKQITPKTMFEAFDKPHSFTFATKASDEPCVYMLAKLEAGGKERIASQSLDGKLEFWMHAKRGESFRVYQIFPRSKTYRCSETLSVEKSYPLGK